MNQGCKRGYSAAEHMHYSRHSNLAEKMEPTQYIKWPLHTSHLDTQPAKLTFCR
jgi:hypothetical protein